MMIDGPRLQCDFCDLTIVLCPGTWDEWKEEILFRGWHSRWIDDGFRHACREHHSELALLERPVRWGRKHKR